MISDGGRRKLADLTISRLVDDPKPLKGLKERTKSKDQHSNGVALPQKSPLGDLGVIFES